MRPLGELPDLPDRRKRPSYEALVAYWVSLGIPEDKARAAARKVHPSIEKEI